MPKYIYKCKECEDIFQTSHSMSERLTDCEKCNRINSLVKLPSNFAVKHVDNQVGKVVNEHIQEAKREVEEEKRRLSQQDWEK